MNCGLMLAGLSELLPTLNLSGLALLGELKVTAVGLDIVSGPPVSRLSSLSVMVWQVSPMLGLELLLRTVSVLSMVAVRMLYMFCSQLVTPLGLLTSTSQQPLHQQLQLPTPPLTLLAGRPLTSKIEFCLQSSFIGFTVEVNVSYLDIASFSSVTVGDQTWV